MEDWSEPTFVSPRLPVGQENFHCCDAEHIWAVMHPRNVGVNVLQQSLDWLNRKLEPAMGGF